MKKKTEMKTHQTELVKTKQSSEFVVIGVQMTEIQHMENGNDASILETK